MKKLEYRETRIIGGNVVVGYKCDNCGAEHNTPTLPDDWHEFSGQHNNWDNDSIESYKEYTACSPECYVKLLCKAVKEFEEYSDGKIDGYTIDFAKRLSIFLKQI